MINALCWITGIGIGFFFGKIHQYTDYTSSLDAALYDERKRTERWRTLAWKSIDARKKGVSSNSID